MSVAFPREPAEYRAARNRLLDQEIELRRAMEAVAAARRGSATADAERVSPRRGTIRHFWGPELLYAPVDPRQDPRWHEQCSY